MRRTRCNGKRGYFISCVSDEEEGKKVEIQNESWSVEWKNTGQIVLM